MKKYYLEEKRKNRKLQRHIPDHPIIPEYVREDLLISQNVSMIMSVLRSAVIRKPGPNYGLHNVRENICILLVTILCTVYSAQASSDVNIMANVCYPGTFTNEFAFTKPVEFVTNPPGYIAKCSASISQP